MKLWIQCLTCGYINGPFDNVDELSLIMELHQLAQDKDMDPRKRSAHEFQLPDKDPKGETDA